MFDRPEPWPDITVGIDVDIPAADDITPMVDVVEFTGVQPYKLVMFGENGQLPRLVTRRQLIFTARRWANTIGNRTPQHDTEGLFAEFENPTALTPGWRQGMRPVIPAPEDPTERLLWAVSDPTAPAKPWLPTVAEQDAAWWAKVRASTRAARTGATRRLRNRRPDRLTPMTRRARTTPVPAGTDDCAPPTVVGLTQPCHVRPATTHAMTPEPSPRAPRRLHPVPPAR